MTTLPFATVVVRAVAAVLIAALATGASWAPAADVTRCDDCRRDLAGHQICESPARAAPARAVTAAKTDGCCESGDPACGQTHADPAEGGDADPESRPANCAPCCVPQPHAPAAPGEVAGVDAAADWTFTSAPAPADAPSPGVHPSVFHPPRA